MIKVQFVLINEDDSEIILESRNFETATSRFDSEINEYVYNKVLDLNAQYDFINFETCPNIEIRYINNKDTVIYYDNCIDYMYGL